MEKNKTQVFHASDFSIELNCKGNSDYIKVSFPVKYGVFSRLETSDHIFEFNLNHEIIHARSKKNTWLHPSEWLKRTMGNDWIYYSTGGYSGVKEALGEYYLPNLTYPTNSVLGGSPFKEPEIDHIIRSWHCIIHDLSARNLPEPFSRWLHHVKQQRPEILEKKADRLFEISGSRVTVMPPDARHVDYNIIPVNIADGCLYKCRFCRVKNKNRFQIRSGQDIDRQIAQLKKLYSRNIINFNAIFLGEHDALNAPDQLIADTTQKAAKQFSFNSSYMKNNYLFMFGSADSLLKKDKSFFQTIGNLDFQTYINIGLESCDPSTLALLGKPLPVEKIHAAFEKIQAVNDRFSNIEVSCNFVMDEYLPESHHKSLMTLLRDRVKSRRSKTSVYISPLKFNSPSRQALYDFYKIKSHARLPAYLYIIQRL